ncbi:MAG TPA: hypothetical protein VN829_16160, partial [Dongiaceae bacterium]|nr:hypothetical protein [Dongiaceae bacterium]
PTGVAVDSSGVVYVADANNSTVRKLTSQGSNWIVTTIAGLAQNPGAADGTNDAARFLAPFDLAVDGAGNLYVSDPANNTIRKMTPVGTNWVVTTFAGKPGVTGTNDGTGSAARFNLPWGVAVDRGGNVYVADGNNSTIRQITPGGVVTTIAGQPGVTGSQDGTSGQFNFPTGVAVDSATNVYVIDNGNSTIREVTQNGGQWIVSTIAGTVGVSGTNDGLTAEFNYPNGLAVDSATNLWVADTFNCLMREVSPVSGIWMATTAAGTALPRGSVDGAGTIAQFNYPFGVAVDTQGDVYVGDYGNNTIRLVTPGGVVTTLAGQPGIPGSNDGTGTNAQFNGPDGLALDTAGNVYVADWGNHTVRKLTPSGTNWVVTTLAGIAGAPGLANGSPGQFSYPSGVAVDTNGNVYVADQGNDAIRKVTPAGAVSTLSTQFGGPSGVALDPSGNVYVADRASHTIRRLTPAGVMTVLAGSPNVPGWADGTNSTARFWYPYGIARDSAGNLYIGDWYNELVRKVTPVGTSWVVTTLGGMPYANVYADGTGPVAQFGRACHVALDGAGNLYVADSGNNVIWKGFPANSVPSPVLAPPVSSDGRLGLGVTGLTNLAVGLESSSDLTHWGIIGVGVLADGTNSFSVPLATPGNQFYRLQVR